ncbi:MAG: hypothetical protein U0172_10390 [Nitrospiraceae bacterium]
MTIETSDRQDSSRPEQVNEATTPTRSEIPPRAPRARIETQIPRRKKGKPILPLESEWDRQVNDGPPDLKRPASHMVRRDPPNESS